LRVLVVISPAQNSHSSARLPSDHDHQPGAPRGASLKSAPVTGPRRSISASTPSM